jgi:pyruvate,water dikinase
MLGAGDDFLAATAQLSYGDVTDLARRAKRAREIVYGAGVPEDLAREIRAGYQRLQQQYGEDVSLAVRSSATAEDLPTASFAGQQDTFLNVRGEESLLDACRRCFASLFTDRAIHYRIDQGFDHFQVALSIGVMKMVRSDLASSGVFFSLDTESGFDKVVFITASLGLGETVVQGAVNPDEFYVWKPGLALGRRAIVRKAVGGKALKMIFADAQRAGKSTATVEVAEPDRLRFSITDGEAEELARYAVIIEEHYGRPMDIEWGRDGQDGKLYILQARPETVKSRESGENLRRYRLKSTSTVLPALFRHVTTRT